MQKKEEFVHLTYSFGFFLFKKLFEKEKNTMTAILSSIKFPSNNFHQLGKSLKMYVKQV